MEQVQNAIKEQRAHTDASLGAERAVMDPGKQRSEAIARRALDDRIERDRNLADAHLRQLRHDADSTLARDRSTAPSKEGPAVAQERHLADQAIKVERDDMDAHVQDERQRSDLIVDRERRDQESRRVELDSRRQDTDDQLSSERHGSDKAVIALGSTKVALAVSENQQGHYGDVLGMVSHDLRAPLLLIAMNAETIAADTQESSIRESAQQVTHAAARMERLLADLIDVVRIQSGTLRITKRLHGIGALLDELLKIYEPLFMNRALTFSIDEPDAVIIASFDYDRIVQVLSNLLGNAMKFTPQGGNVILRVQQRGEYVEFSLSDNGPGIDPNDLPRIFERFWQIENYARRGLGLGLYICRKIVEEHGGTIVAESELGKGTTLRFTLPMT
jgi:signal transduction histidine kinase